MRRKIILDTETTAVTPDYPRGSGVIWELALIEYGHPDGTPAHMAEHMWRMKPEHLDRADQAALTVGRFYDRTAGMCGRCTRPDRSYDLTIKSEPGEQHWSSPEALAGEMARELSDVTLVCAVPSFDAGYLRAWLNHYGHQGTWHYRLRDIGSLAHGYLSGLWRVGQPPVPSVKLPPLDASTDDFAVALGVDPSQFERHSALGDCRLVAAMLDVITGGA